MPTTTLEITTISEIEAATETSPKVEIETTTEREVEVVIDEVPFIGGFHSSGVIQKLTTNLLIFAILISSNFLRHL